ncbi:hypothetical protein BH10BAC3_BH10BAC3_23920 [soil metagenome]
MFGLLHQYLVENRSVYLRGTGQIHLEHQPASYDVANKVLHAPHTLIHLHANEQAGSLQPLMAFLSSQLQVAEQTAFSLYEAFCNQLQQDIENKTHVTFTSLGVFKKDAVGSTVFLPDMRLSAYNTHVQAHRVIRHGTTHNMMVGTRETTNTAMIEMLQDQQTDEPVNSRWWIAATIMGVVAIVLILLKKMQFV